MCEPQFIDRRSCNLILQHRASSVMNQVFSAQVDDSLHNYPEKSTFVPGYSKKRRNPEHVYCKIYFRNRGCYFISR